ncbi:GIY-YIG nuclease family protein [Oceaniferula marina]|uniref:GIY-YIG nuclease family protein n=1 Tax=Oceaniferula marina TaxID=2748318 RepID=UPI003CCD6B17
MPKRVQARICTKEAPSFELILHKFFEAGRVNKGNRSKEFFRVNILKIKEHIDSHAIDAKWTMAAEAQQFEAIGP